MPSATLAGAVRLSLQGGMQARPRIPHLHDHHGLSLGHKLLSFSLADVLVSSDASQQPRRSQRTLKDCADMQQGWKDWPGHPHLRGKLFATALYIHACVYVYIHICTFLICSFPSLLFGLSNQLQITVGSGYPPGSHEVGVHKAGLMFLPPAVELLHLCQSPSLPPTKAHVCSGPMSALLGIVCLFSQNHDIDTKKDNKVHKEAGSSNDESARLHRRRSRDASS